MLRNDTPKCPECAELDGPLDAVDRRDFMRVTAGTAAAALVTGTAPLAVAAQNPATNQLHVWDWTTGRACRAVEFDCSAEHTAVWLSAHGTRSHSAVMQRIALGQVPL